MEKLEPLLKEKEDKFYFVKENKEKKVDKNKMEIIVTSVIGVIVLWLMWYTLYPFYVGFVHYDEGHNVVSEDKTEEELPVNAALVNGLYNYLDVTNDNELSSLFTALYSGNNISGFNDNQKLMVTFKYLGVTCSGNEVVKGLDEIKAAARKIFNYDSFVNLTNENNNIGEYNISYNEANNNYVIKLNSCVGSNDFVVRNILKATNNGDEIYIYEAFGYFVNLEDNKYVVYGDSMKNNKIGDYVDENGNREFNEFSELKQFKWTFKKSSDNNYYFVSVTPSI